MNYKERRAAGLCGKCGEKPEDDGSLCTKCRKKERLRAEKKRARGKASGICINCSKPAVNGVKCEGCKTKGAESRTRAIARRKDRGQCTACSNPAKDGCTLCQDCITYRSKVSSEHYARRKEDGSCRLCNNPPIEGESFCEYHKQSTREYRLKIKAAAFAAYGGPQCATCLEDDTTILEIDHIKGGGNKHRKEINVGSGHPFYQWLQQQGYPPGFRVLCPTCNKKAHIDLKAQAQLNT